MSLILLFHITDTGCGINGFEDISLNTFATADLKQLELFWANPFG